jgi:hypothetical protein
MQFLPERSFFFSERSLFYGAFQPVFTEHSALYMPQIRWFYKVFVFVFKQPDSCCFVVLKPMDITAKT